MMQTRTNRGCRSTLHQGGDFDDLVYVRLGVVQPSKATQCARWNVFQNVPSGLTMDPDLELRGGGLGTTYQHETMADDSHRWTN